MGTTQSPPAYRFPLIKVQCMYIQATHWWLGLGTYFLANTANAKGLKTGKKTGNKGR